MGVPPFIEYVIQPRDGNGALPQRCDSATGRLGFSHDPATSSVTPEHLLFF